VSPGATFERVYNELKRMLADGELRPGSSIEPALIGELIASSITPIRDALHRLTGERLVEAPNHNGFRVPLPTEAALRDLYTWNGLVLRLAAKRRCVGLEPEAVDHRIISEDIASRTAELFLSIARAGESDELTVSVALLNERLAAIRRVEATALESVTEELSGLTNVFCTSDRSALAGALTRYHRRRVVAVASILAHLTLPASR
jgi:hypothetical protein